MADNNDVLVSIGADISDISSKLTKVKSQLKEMGASGEQSTDGVGKGLSGLGGIAGKLGGVMAAAFSVKKIVDFGKEVLDTGMTFEASMSKVGAISGATGSELDKLSGYAREVAKTSVYSASEAADALSYMALAGWDSTQMMDGLNGVLNLAAAGQLDLAFASDTVTDTLTMFGLEAKDSGRMVDVMATAQAKSNTNVTQLSEALRYAGGTAKTFGMDIEETSAALGILANAGVKGSVAGSSLRSILSRLAAPTKAVNEGLETLGVTIEDDNGNIKPFNDILHEMKGKFDNLGEAQQVQVAKQIAGQEAMSSFISLLGSADGELQALTDQMYNSNGAAEKMSNTMSDNLQGSLKLMSASWEEMKLKLYDVAGGPTRAVVDGLTSIMDSFNNLGKTGLEWKEGFGATVSEATANSVLNFQDMNRTIQGTIDQMTFLGGTVTPEFHTMMVGSLQQWKTDSDTILTQKYSDDLTALQTYFAANQGITETEQQAMIDRLNEFYGRERESQQTYADEMLGIVQGAFDEERSLTANELARLTELQSRNYADILNMAATSQDEELALLNATKDEKGRISAEASEAAYANAKETRDNIVSEAESAKDEEIKQAYRLKEAGIITEEEYGNMVKTANDKYSEIEKNANNAFYEVYKAVKKNAEDMGKDFNYETGQIESQWATFCNFVTGKIATFSAKYKVDVEQTTTKKTVTVNSPSSTPRYAGGVSTANYGTRAVGMSDVPMPRLEASGNNVSTTPNGGLSINLHGVTIREEADIKKLAQELYKLQQRNKRAKGVVAYV